MDNNKQWWWLSLSPNFQQVFGPGARLCVEEGENSTDPHRPHQYARVGDGLNNRWYTGHFIVLDEHDQHKQIDEISRAPKSLPLGQLVVIGMRGEKHHLCHKPSLALGSELSPVSLWSSCLGLVCSQEKKQRRSFPLLLGSGRAWEEEKGDCWW